MSDKLIGSARQLVTLLRRHFIAVGFPPKPISWELPSSSPIFIKRRKKDGDFDMSGFEKYLAEAMSITGMRSLLTDESWLVRDAIAGIQPIREVALLLRDVDAELESTGLRNTRFAYLLSNVCNNVDWFKAINVDVLFTKGRATSGKMSFVLEPIASHVVADLESAIRELVTDNVMANVSDISNNANIRKLFPNMIPDSDVVDLAVRLDSAKGTNANWSEIARTLTGESLNNDPKAKKLLARIRMMRKRGHLNL